jgi:hypothetical protein
LSLKIALKSNGKLLVILSPVVEIPAEAVSGAGRRENKWTLRGGKVSRALRRGLRAPVNTDSGVRRRPARGSPRFGRSCMRRLIDTYAGLEGWPVTDFCGRSAEAISALQPA